MSKIRQKNVRWDKYSLATAECVFNLKKKQKKIPQLVLKNQVPPEAKTLHWPFLIPNIWLLVFHNISYVIYLNYLSLVFKQMILNICIFRLFAQKMDMSSVYISLFWCRKNNYYTWMILIAPFIYNIFHRNKTVSVAFLWVGGNYFTYHRYMLFYINSLLQKNRENEMSKKYKCRQVALFASIEIKTCSVNPTHGCTILGYCRYLFC